MASTEITTKREGGLLLVTLNRPGQLNALNKDLFEELQRLVDVLETDKTVRAMILTGSGEKAFCVGADLKERQGMNEKDVLVRMDFVHKLYTRLENLPFPVIAAINGIALGGGLELALACDFRVCAENATLGFPEVELAIIPGNGGTQRLARLLGMAKALELVLLAKRLTATEAAHYGLVTRTVPVGQAVSEARVWATKLMEAGPLAVKQAKAAIRGGLERPLVQGLQWELERYKETLYSKDRLEGLKAFSEKRKPSYTGS